MNTDKTRNKKSTGTAFVILLVCALLPSVFGMTADHGSQVTSVTLDIGHRMHPDFYQQIKTEMNKREQVGDTDYFFEIIEFFPHFTYVDSTKEIVSLSDEPKNAAFKIRVYENDEIVEDTWAFYSVKVPHFSPASYLTFQAVQFEYRGDSYGGDDEQEEEAE